MKGERDKVRDTVWKLHVSYLSKNAQLSLRKIWSKATQWPRTDYFWYPVIVLYTTLTQALQHTLLELSSSVSLSVSDIRKRK